MKIAPEFRRDIHKLGDKLRFLSDHRVPREVHRCNSRNQLASRCSIGRSTFHNLINSGKLIAESRELRLATVCKFDRTWPEWVSGTVADFEARYLAANNLALRARHDAEVKSLPDQRSIPPLSRAAAEPIWERGKLRLPSRQLQTDLSQHEFADAVASLRRSINDLISDIGEQGNIDHRFVIFLRRVNDQLPRSAPNSREIFQLGHSSEILERYKTIAEAEWPAILSSQFHGLVRQLDRTLRQSTLWREFVRNAAAETLNSDQIEPAGRLAAEFAEELRTEEASAFVDATVPELLEKLAGDLDAPEFISRPTKISAVDLIESINNILKRIAEQALAARDAVNVAARSIGDPLIDTAKAYAGSAVKGLKMAAREQGVVDGAKAFYWFRGIVITGIGGTVSTTAVSQLISKYPQTFSWIKDFVGHLF